MIPMDTLSEAAACLKVIAHPVRLKIIDILMQGDFTVREISAICEIKEHQICEHLRLMQNCRLLTSVRQGRTVHYKILAPQLPSLMACVREHCGKRSDR